MRLGIAGLVGAMILATTPVQAQNDGQDRWVTIINQTQTTMTEFYASRTTTNQWGHDRLGRGTIWPGYEKRLNIVDGTNACIYDFKAVFEDGSVTHSSRPVNVCTSARWRVYN